MGFLVVNLKQYPVATGKNSIGFLEKLKKIRGNGKTEILFAVASSDLLACSSKFGKSIMSQHFDPVAAGPHTGSLSNETLLNIGIKRSLLNHSERRLPFEVIMKSLSVAHSSGLEVILCAESQLEIEKFSRLEVEHIAYEPPELIGGNVSVSTAKPEIIRNAALICRRSGQDLLVGAGVKKENDVTLSIELGASGILVSSGVVLSSDPSAALSSLAKALS